MENFGKYTAYTIGWILNLVVFCVVLSQLWTWFIVPLGFPVLSAVHAYGLSLIILLMKARNMNKSLKPEFYYESTFGLKMSVGILVSLVALLFGWFTTLFM